MGNTTRLIWPRTVTGDGEGPVSHAGLVWLGAANGRASIALGGTGIGMARALTPYFDEVQLIGAIGDDTSGMLVKALLPDEQFSQALEVVPRVETGVVVAMRDGPSGEHAPAERAERPRPAQHPPPPAPSVEP